MPLHEYHLYRIKFIKPSQIDFLHDQGITPTLLFLKSLAEKPSSEFKQSFKWHIGNVTELDTTAGYFAVGRSTTATIPKFDPQSGDFGDKEDDTSPYTFVIFDATIGLLAIRKKTLLAPTTEAIAFKIQKLLGQTSPVLKNGVTVKIDLIPNPDSFLEIINSAYAVKAFTATFTGPNPFDADELFQKPLSVYLSHANGTNGQTTVMGSDLNRDVVTEVSRSTVATGNTASAHIQDAPGKRAYKVNIRHNPVKLVYDSETEPTTKQVLADARTSYTKIRLL